MTFTLKKAKRYVLKRAPSFYSGPAQLMNDSSPLDNQDSPLILVPSQLFYQVKGDMVLRVMERGQPKDIRIKEGEVRGHVQVAALSTLLQNLAKIRLTHT